jgi:hypothetical protein
LEQNYFIWHKKKRWNVRHVMRKMKKKVNLGVLGVSLYVSKGVPWSCLDPLARLGNTRIDMGLFVIRSLGASGHLLDMWLESHNLLDHSPSQYTHWKLGWSLSPFNGLTYDGKIFYRSSLYSSRMNRCSMNQISSTSRNTSTTLQTHLALLFLSSL